IGLKAGPLCRSERAKRPKDLHLRSRIRDVIRLRHARRRHGRPTVPVALYGLLLTSPTLRGDAFDVLRGLAHFGVRARPLLRQIDARIDVPVDVIRRALTTTSRSDGVALPMRLRVRVVALAEQTLSLI